MAEASNSLVPVKQDRIRLRDLVLRIQQTFLSQKKENDLFNRVSLRLQQTGYDTTFFKVAQQHAKVMEVVMVGNKKDFENLKFVSPEECLSYYIAKVFFDKMLLYESLNFPVKINYVERIAILPIQAFLKGDDEARFKFEKTLKVNDILYVEVLKTDNVNVEHLELRIIGRVDLNDETDNEFIYHLNSHAFMFKQLELTQLGRTEFSASEIFKVTVLGRTRKSLKTFVTTNIDALKVPARQKSSVVLGNVSPKDVPFDLNSIKIARNFQGYANYLRSLPTFYHSFNLKEEIASIGIDPYRIYSFYPTRDGLTIPPNKSAASLYDSAKVAMHGESPAHLANAKKLVEKGDYESAIETFNDSLKCWPENYQVYEMRGKMRLGLCKKKDRRGRFLKDAMQDFETALELNPSAHEPKSCLSEIFTYLSKRLVKNKEHDKAKKLVETALKLSPENKEATAVLQRIDKVSYVVIEEDLDLTTLKMRKKLIEKQLKKEIAV